LEDEVISQENGRVVGDRLPRSAEVVVIGGGVNGASTAFQLTKRGVRDVVLLERRQLGAGATGKSGALVRAHYSNVPETRLTLESLKIFRNWGDAVGHGDPGFEVTGFVRVVAPHDEAKLRANVVAQQAIGGETWVVTAEELREIEPLMRTDDLTVAGFEPTTGFADPNATLYGFVAAAIAGGARVLTLTEATAIVVEGERVAGVETTVGTIATRRVVLAGGAYADRLLRPLGVDLGLQPRRSRVVVFRWPAEIDQARRHRVVIDSTQHSWFRPEGKAGTLIGVEHGDRGAVDPETAPESVEQDYIARARQALAARFPVFAHATMRGGWSGVFMQSPDDHPIIDHLPQVEGLYVMTGDSGTSFKTSPAIGVCLAEWITAGEAQLVDLQPFRSTRFAEGKPWVDELAYAGEIEQTISR
jgi:sarcosine oxidase subunit beta